MTGVQTCALPIFNKRIEIGGVHSGYRLPQKVPTQGTISQYSPAVPEGAVEPRGDRSRGLQLTEPSSGSYVTFELMFDTTPDNRATQVLCLKTSVTVLHQNIGDTSWGPGGDTSAPKLRRADANEPIVPVSAPRSPKGPTRLAERTRCSVPSIAYTKLVLRVTQTCQGARNQVETSNAARRSSATRSRESDTGHH